MVNKQAGISVQGGTKSKKNLIDIFSKSKIFENTKPFSVHRLDKDTSGVFIIAKNRECAKRFPSEFRAMGEGSWRGRFQPKAMVLGENRVR